MIQVAGRFDGPPFQPSLNIPFIDFDGAILGERSLTAALQYLAAGDLSGLELRNSNSIQLIDSGDWGACIDNTPGVKACQAVFRVETVSVRPTEIDTDNDGVLDTADFCPGTVIPEAAPTSGKLGNGRHALTVADSFDFSTGDKGANAAFDTADTAGCSCEQIVDELFLGDGQLKFGCSNSVMESWVNGLPFDPSNP